MTAEVIIMNKRGVAIAADSACTRSSSDGTPTKIFNSAKKLFNLSQKCPIGVVTYNNASFNGIPWDLLFQDFYSRYTDSWLTVEDCKDAFIHYLETTPLKGDTESFYNSIIWELTHRYTDDSSLFIDIEINGDNFELSNADNRFGFDDDFCSQVADIYREKISNFVDHGLLYENITPEHKEIIKKNILLALYKENSFLKDSYSGIAICGYGTTEFFPTCQELIIKGTLLNKLIYEDKVCTKINNVNNGTIIPLAQRDVMDGFISGIQNNVKNSIHKSMTNIVRGFRRNTINKIRQLPNADQLPLKQIEEIIREQVYNAENKITPQINNSHSHISESMVTMISDLNIPDMGKIAKNLISMTSFRREISDTWETVGGPVDVAVISKTDGFVWIEKKDIYDRDLNVHTNNSFSIQEY